jgi:CheY-like chemotaxis protein
MAKKRILLVDDSNTVLLMERMMLQGAGYEVLTARNGKEAVEKATKEHPDLVLMDMIMPEMNGLDACKALRGQASTRELPVIMVTTRSEPFNVQAGYESGCTEYVTKPFDGVELMAKLRNYLGE